MVLDDFEWGGRLIGPNGPQVRMSEPTGVLGQMAQSAFHTVTDDIGWVEDAGEAYLFFVTGFVAALQLLALGDKDIPAAAMEAAEMIRDLKS